MILHGNSVRAGIGTLPLAGETTCTLNIKTETVKTAGGTARTTDARPTLRSWELTAQFRFTWSLFIILFVNITSMTAKLWTVTGDNYSNKWTFSGYGFIRRVSFASQGRGLLSLNLTVIGTGAPKWQTEDVAHQFTLGTSKLGSTNDLI